MRVLLIAVVLVLGACYKPEPVVESSTPSVEQKRAERAAELPESMQRHWTFLNRIRQDEAFDNVIDRTMLNEEKQISIVLFSSVKPEQVPAVMDKMMSEMALEFPREDVTLAVYIVATPPRKIGTAHLDGQSEKTTYKSL